MKVPPPQALLQDKHNSDKQSHNHIYCTQSTASLALREHYHFCSACQLHAWKVAIHCARSRVPRTSTLKTDRNCGQKKTSNWETTITNQEKKYVQKINSLSLSFLFELLELHFHFPTIFKKFHFKPTITQLHWNTQFVNFQFSYTISSFTFLKTAQFEALSLKHVHLKSSITHRYWKEILNL